MERTILLTAMVFSNAIVIGLLIAILMTDHLNKPFAEPINETICKTMRVGKCVNWTERKVNYDR